MREINAMVHIQNKLVDEAMGRLMDYLKARGWDEETDVFYCSDHGTNQGDFGLMFKGPFHTDGLMRLPFIWRPAPSAGVEGGKVIADPVGHIDLAPTFARIAGLPVPDWVEGGPLPTEADPERDCVFCEWDAERHGIQIKMRSIYDRSGYLCTAYDKTNYYGGTEGELYDLKADPRQWSNLWDNPAHSEIKAAAASDGYNLLFAPVGTMTTQPHLRNTSYNVDSWTPICMVSEGPYYLVVGAESGIETLDDYKALSADGGPRFVGAGPGSMDHVAQLTLDRELGIAQQYLPTKGGPDKATEIGGGRADGSVWFADFDTRFNFRALAIMADERSEQHPDIPTMKELGYDVTVSIWFGLFAQDDAPADAVAKLSEACGTAVSADSFVENMTGANRLIRYMDTEEFGTFFRKTFELNGELMREAGLVK